MVRFLAGVFCAALVFVSPSFAQDAPATPNDFRTLLSDIGESDDVVGLAVAVVRGGDVDYIETFGVKALGNDEPVDEHTLFRIASLSKGVAASVVGQLIAEDKTSLATPVKSFAKDLRLKSAAALNKLTLEHVLSHRTGLPPYAYDNLLEANTAPADIRRKYAEVDPICAVGSCYAYQNVAFDTVTGLIEGIDGLTYADAVSERLFGPLGMTRASTGSDNLKADENWARPHRRRPGQPWRTVPVKEAYYRVPAAGGVNASITDMAAWLAAQMGHREDVLSRETLALLHAPLVRTPAEIRRLRRFFGEVEDAQYGLGWRIYRYGGATVISHFGSVDFGYGAQITFLPEQDVGIVILTNSQSKGFAKLLPAFLDEELERR